MSLKSGNSAVICVKESFCGEYGQYVRIPRYVFTIQEKSFANLGEWLAGCQKNWAIQSILLPLKNKIQMAKSRGVSIKVSKMQIMKKFSKTVKRKR